MADIGQSIRFVHVLGIVFIAAVCLSSLCVRCEQGQSSGALTVVEMDEDEDGVVTVEENGQEVEDQSQNVEVEDFEPTANWKDVKKGQKIPPGLHVRMDFETGKKQAKLMDDAVKTTKWDAGDKIGIINTQQKTRFTIDELKKTLKDFKYNDDKKATDQVRAEKIKNKFRSYDELKKVLKDVELAPKTEGEIVSGLLARLKKKERTSEETVVLLTDLEYYLHQIDNAHIFCDKGGISVLMSVMNSTSDEHRALAAHTIGSALQSNAKAQIAALEAGAMQHLLKMLSVDPSSAVQRKSLFALSTLIRQFPYAQKQFLAFGGLSALADLFKSSAEESLRIKIVTLLTDLLIEYDFNIAQENTADSNQVMKIQQYKEMGLRSALLSSGWCPLMTSLVQSSSGHDSVEKVVAAMSALVSTCRKDFSPARTHLQGLLASYQQLAQEEREDDDHEDFFSSIHSSLQVLINKLHKDEL